MLCFRKFPVVKKLMDERVGGISRFSVEKYLSDSAENFRGWGEIFRVSFISGIDKNWIRGGKAVSRFSGQNFLSHSAEKFSKETFSVSLISIMEKNFCFRGLCHDLRFSVESLFVSQC